MVKNLPANVGDSGDAGSIPRSERSPGGGNGNPFQYSCLEHPMDRGAWRAAIQGVTMSQTRLSGSHTHTLLSVITGSVLYIGSIYPSRIF